MIKEEVILVNGNDEPVGVEGKMEAHQKGLLHRAFSIFIFDSRGRMLLQQRSSEKYHGGHLWTNACCSHPRPGENTLAAAERRLFEELGFVTSLSKIFDFSYKVVFENGLTENEYDHVYVGLYGEGINPDFDEVEDYCYKDVNEISNLLSKYPYNYTAWFHIAFPKVINWWNTNKSMVLAP